MIVSVVAAAVAVVDNVGSVSPCCCCSCSCTVAVSDANSISFITSLGPTGIIVTSHLRLGVGVWGTASSVVVVDVVVVAVVHSAASTTVGC